MSCCRHVSGEGGYLANHSSRLEAGAAAAEARLDERSSPHWDDEDEPSSSSSSSSSSSGGGGVVVDRTILRLSQTVIKLHNALNSQPLWHMLPTDDDGTNLLRVH